MGTMRLDWFTPDGLPDWGDGRLFLVGTEGTLELRKNLDLEGRPQEEDAEGLFATCIQHEVDHLNGVLFIDHISKLKRDRIVKKFTKAAKRAEQDST